jgi:H/ACA ribonucleoprotein complex subunit 3
VTRSRIQWCRACDAPTLKDTCAQCGAVTVNPLPPKFSPEDPYGKYRRELKRRTKEEAA